MTATRYDSPALIFVYNADSGLFNTLSDTVHKLVSPHTYTCRLCKLTYGNFAMRREWKTFIENLGRPVEFLHRDEFAANYGASDISLPAVLQHDGETIKTVIDADTLNACESISDLKELLTARLESG
jgi:hypothetical protein